MQRWFVRRRGAASGLAVAGIGVGTLIGAPLAHELIATIGWRKTYLVLACITAAGAVVASAASVQPQLRVSTAAVLITSHLMNLSLIGTCRSD